MGSVAAARWAGTQTASPADDGDGHRDHAVGEGVVGRHAVEALVP